MSTSIIRMFCRTAARLLLPLLLLLLSTTMEAEAQDFWQPTNGLSGGNIQCLAINNSNGNIFTGTLGGGVYRSIDNGGSWTPINTGLTNLTITALAINSSGYIFAGTDGNGVFRSTNNGDSWAPFSNGLTNTVVLALAVDSQNNIYAGTSSGGGIFKLENNDSTWMQRLQNEVVKAFAINSADWIFAGTNSGGVYRSKNYGVNWETVNTGLTIKNIWSLAVNNGSIFAGVDGGEILQSTSDDVVVWTSAKSGIPNTLSLAINSRGHIFAGTNGGGAFLSTDNGNMWSAVNTGLTELHVYTLAINSNGYIFAGTGGGGVFKSVKSTTGTFAKITTGEIVADGGSSQGSAWGDYDNDGDLDLIVANAFIAGAGGTNFLYRNDGGDSFTRIKTGVIVAEGRNSRGATWGDFTGDGYLDLFIANTAAIGVKKNNALYINNQAGDFTEVTSGVVVEDSDNSQGCSWVDYDKDGDLDLFVTNDNTSNRLYRNEGSTFINVTIGHIVTDQGNAKGVAWGDYDNDGWDDLFVANENNENNFLYHNNGDGTFTKVISGPIVTDGGKSQGGSWGDYDNDGDLDLFVTNADNQTNFLYRNLGNGSFEMMTAGILVSDPGDWHGSAWGDYDNDGKLDLFVADLGANNALYHNEGNGNFTKIAGESLVTDGGNSRSCAWGDYNRDGFLDMFVANEDRENNFLYRNNGNGNHWINIKCAGTTSNKSAIGAKVRVKATIQGKPIWQMQEISGQTGYFSQNSLNAEFGLGDATIIDSIKVEWPNRNRTVQVLTNINADQFLAIIEGTANQPPASPVLSSPVQNTFLNAASPSLTFSVPPDANGDQLHFKIEIDEDGIFGTGTQMYDSKTSTVGFNPTPPVIQGTGQITYTVQSALAEGDWWWRVSAWDGQIYGASSATRRFVVDASPPQILHTAMTSAPSGQSQAISATITDNIGVQSAALFYRLGGASGFTSIQMTRGANDNYQGSIPSNTINERGTEYYISVEDSAKNLRTFPLTNPQTRPQVIQVTNNNLAFANPTPVKAYRMISVPFDLNDKSAASVLGDDFPGSYDQTQWRLLRYVNGVNVEFNRPDFNSVAGLFAPGAGFWLITKEAKTLDAGAGKSVTTADSFDITLPPGWSQIGNPFAFTVNWSDVIKGAEVENKLWGYQGTLNEATGYDMNRTQLVPFEGYFVNNKGSNPTTIKILPKAATGSAAAKPVADWKSALQDKEWALQITAASGRYLDKDNYIGCLNEAADEWDANDFSEAPFFDQHVSLYFPHPEWPKYPDLYTGDFRAAKSEGDYWDFLVKSEVRKSEVARSEVILKLAEVQNLPADWQIILLDKTSLVSINFGEEKKYTFLPEVGKAQREFRIVVGREGFIESNDLRFSGIPQDFVLGQNYPNPFNPETRINYELPSISHLKITLYNLSGQFIRALFDGEQSAGRYTVAWDGSNASGNRVASGVYLVRMEAGNPSTSSGQRFVAVRKMILTK